MRVILSLFLVLFVFPVYAEQGTLLQGSKQDCEWVEQGFAIAEMGSESEEEEGQEPEQGPEQEQESGPEQGPRAEEVQGQEEAMYYCRSEVFKPSHLVSAGLVFSAGAVGVHWDFYNNNINTPIKNFGDGLRSKYGAIRIDDYLQYAPAAAYMTFGAFGMGNHRFIEKSLVCATSWATMGILVNVLKYSIADLKPDGSTYNSFPSGHTATAFMGAELVMIEYGGWYGVGAYALATSVALMRIYNGRHWFSDLLGGAAIGALSARVGYYLLPLERKLFGIEGHKGGSQTSFVVVPFATGGAQNVYGLSLALEF